MAQASELNTIVQNVNDAIDNIQKCLVLKAMSQYVQKDMPRAPAPARSATSSYDHNRDWRKFLDKLSYLCDFDSGGSTVAAIAVQADVEGPIFWLATNCLNDKTRTRMDEHVRFVLDQLANSDRTVDQIMASICSKSIELSKNKVVNYRSILGRELKRIVIQDLDLEELTVHRSVLDIIHRSGTDTWKLCSAARELVSGNTYRLLLKLSNQDKGRLDTIRHYVGRLCSWHVAARHLARRSAQFSNSLQNARVRILPADTFTPTNRIQFSSDQDEVLLWALGKQNQILLPSLKSMFVHTVGFLAKYGDRSFETIIHAEAALAQFFYARDLRFELGDRYIGCSKRSCFACNIYLSQHPGNFAPRPSHNNAWFRWYPPRLAAQTNDRMTNKVLRKMGEEMQVDLDAAVQGKDLGKRQPFESTDGVGTTIRQFHGSSTSVEGASNPR